MGIASPPSELPAVDELLARARGGDPHAFCQLAAQHENRLLAQARGLVRDAAEAEDLTCETLTEAWRSLSRYNGACRFSTWLFSILFHRFQKHLRKARRRPVPFSSLSSPELLEWETTAVTETDPEPSPAERVMGQEAAAALRNAVRTLPEKHQEVLLLRFFERASLADIAQLLGCSVGTVKSRLYYALEGLREQRQALNLSEHRRDTGGGR